MVNWKVVLAVIVLVILIMAVGMWFGYQYVSEQEDITPEGHREPSDTKFLCHDQLFMLAAVPSKIP